MPKPSDSTIRILAKMSHVLLVRYGPVGHPGTYYQVVEKDHVAQFSRRNFGHPLKTAVDFFLDHANLSYRRNLASRN